MTTPTPDRWIFGRRPGDEPPPRPRRAEPTALPERALRARRELQLEETRRHRLQAQRLEALMRWLSAAAHADTAANGGGQEPPRSGPGGEE
jgi:hypothetical protein